MISKRIIPCFDVRDGMVVKGQKFENIKEVSEPVILAKKYNELGADELVFYDITASYEERKLFTEVVEKIANEVFIPLTVGGGINTVEDFSRVLKAGADKVSINSSAVKNPHLITEAAKKFGSQCVVLSIDVKRVDGKFMVFVKGGRENTGLDAIEWAKKGEELGAGELVINSMDMDGVKEGFDRELLEEISKVVTIPIIASGGAGNMTHFKEVFNIKGVDAGLAASIFHFGEVEIPELKRYLKNEGIPTRI
jgi:cyclase